MKNARNEVGGLLLAAWSSVAGCWAAGARFPVGTEIGNTGGDGALEVFWACGRVGGGVFVSGP
jgi:hypothetical protein